VSAQPARQGRADRVAGRGRVITRERVRNYSVIFLVGSVVALGTSIVVALVVPRGQRLPLPDFLAHWTGGRMLADGLRSRLYDPAAQQALQTAAGSPPDILAWFVSPPFVTAVYLPFALLPYLAACAAWTGASLAMLGTALRGLGLFAPRLWARERRLVVMVVFASYPVFELLGSGQDSALALLVWVVAVGLSVRGRQVAAGLVFSVGLVKPQLVVLVPVVFVLLRQFRGLVAFAGGCASVGVASVAVAGTNGLVSWLEALTSGLYTEQVTVGQSWKMVSLPALATALLGLLGHRVAAVGAAFAVFAPLAWFIVRGCVRPGSPLWFWTAGLATTVVAAPHLLVYDAVLLVPVAMFALERAPSNALNRLLTVTFCAAWLMPLARAAGPSLGSLGVVAAVPWVAVAVGGLWWYVMEPCAAPRALPLAEDPGLACRGSGRSCVMIREGIFTKHGKRADVGEGSRAHRR
jgi:hypothetical protein